MQESIINTVMKNYAALVAKLQSRTVENLALLRYYFAVSALQHVNWV